MGLYGIGDEKDIHLHIVADLFPSCIRLVILQMQLILESPSTMGKSFESRCKSGDGQPTMLPPMKTAILKGCCIAGSLDVRSEERLRLAKEEDPAIPLVMKNSASILIPELACMLCPPLRLLISYCSQSSHQIKLCLHFVMYEVPLGKG